MKHSLVKLTGLLVALTLVLTGCNLIAVDPLKQLDEDFAKLKDRYSAVVAEYEGGKSTLADVMSYYQQQMSYLNMYQQMGMNVTNSDVQSALQNVGEYGVMLAAVNKEFEDRGLTLSDERLAEAQSEADEMWQQAYDSYYAQAEGENDEVRAKQTEYNMYADGYTKDGLYYNSLTAARYEALQEALNAEVDAPTEEELLDAYNAAVSEDEETYTNYPSSFESAMSNENPGVYWIPEGYRTVKHILVIPEEDVLSAVTDARKAYSDATDAVEALESELEALNDDDPGETGADEEAAEDAETVEETETEEEAEPVRTAEEIESELTEARANAETLKAAVEDAEAACLASQQEKLDEIYSRIEAGEDFAALIEEYGEDPGMQNEPTKTRGYYVSEKSTRWDVNFKNAAMALENVGDVTETPAIGTSGIHIIRYESDVVGGAVDFESVRDALSEETLTSKQNTHLNDSVQSWIDALKPTYHLDVLSATN